MNPKPASISATELMALAARLKGHTAWRSRAGSGTGSIFTMEFGPALVTNPRQGILSLMVYCAWRVVKADRLVYSWRDDSDAVIAPGLSMFEGQAVTKVYVTHWNDLNLLFSTGQELQIINDFSPLREFDTSWFITHNGTHHYCVNNDNSITLELTSS